MTVTAAVPAGNTRGIIAMVLSQASFIVNDALIKLAVAELPAGQAIFIRGLFATALIGAIAAAMGVLGGLAPLLRSPRIALRNIGEIGSTFFYLIALFQMQIADATAIMQFGPLAIMAAAALFLGEPVGWRRWLATLVGLIGVLIIIRPGSSGFNAWSLVALVSIVFMVLRDLCTRGIATSVPTVLISLAGSLAVTLTAACFAPFETWLALTPAVLATLAAASVFLFGGYYFIVDAMRYGDVGAVAPFRYSVIVFALIAGYAIWGEIPDGWSLVGLAIVLAAGLYSLFRERVVKAQRHSAANKGRA